MRTDGPPEAGDVSRYFPGKLAVDQGEGDLGARISMAFEQSFYGNADGAAVIGSDAPLFSASAIAEGFEALAHSSSSIRPSDDGGFLLLALRPRALSRSLFKQIAWSTDSVSKELISRLTSAGHSPKVMASGFDVDTAADVRRLCAEIDSLKKMAPETARFLSSHPGTSGWIFSEARKPGDRAEEEQPQLALTDCGNSK